MVDTCPGLTTPIASLETAPPTSACHHVACGLKKGYDIIGSQREGRRAPATSWNIQKALLPLPQDERLPLDGESPGGTIHQRTNWNTMPHTPMVRRFSTRPPRTTGHNEVIATAIAGA
ncbi:hypothetical protein EYZ11_008251 [Aspergillus tanneri]|uniref:Uncharacterized protein n=1 Tax=Aspergillus tanneri TaxID=1220188 RepID=A0A4S3JAW2_9EURO|nr:hypothetical protein EYZ11_008251 [Aspergillus tanneri]